MPGTKTHILDRDKTRRSLRRGKRKIRLASQGPAAGAEWLEGWRCSVARAGVRPVCPTAPCLFHTVEVKEERHYCTATDGDDGGVYMLFRMISFPKAFNAAGGGRLQREKLLSTTDNFMGWLRLNEHSLQPVDGLLTASVALCSAP